MKLSKKQKLSLQKTMSRVRWDLIRRPQPAPPTAVEYALLDKTILFLEVDPKLWRKHGRQAN